MDRSDGCLQPAIQNVGSFASQPPPAFLRLSPTKRFPPHRASPASPFVENRIPRNFQTGSEPKHRPQNCRPAGNPPFEGSPRAVYLALDGLRATAERTIALLEERAQR